MGILDGFWFWIGKALAELFVALVVILLFGAVMGLIIWRQDVDARKRRERAAAEQEGK